MSKIRKKSLALFTIPLVVMLALVLVTTVLAVHDLGLFELDRNATDEGGGGDDWATLYGGGGSAADFTGIIEDTMATNPFGTVGTQFQAGGSKDDLDIGPGGATGQYWKWEPGEPLDKDDITNAYAAAYINTVDTGFNNIGDLIVFFGLDRFANNGSAQVGFWFLQDPNFGLTTIKDGGGYQFSGHHEIGDILVQSNFTNGGVIDNISVYEWVGSGGSKGTLDLLFNAQDCFTTGADDPACATVNQGDASSPWPYTPKFGTAGTFPQGSFFEGGINISRLVPDAGCFTGFLAETRSSTPFDSRLKDFAFGDFSLCSIDVDKDGDTLSKVGDDVDYTITITNTGAITLYKQFIVDTVFGPLTDGTNPLITTSDCGASLAPGAYCTIEVTRTVLVTDTDPLDNTVTVVYDSKSDLLGDEVNSSDDHSVNLFQPSIAADKTGDALSKVGDVITYTITLSNNSSADTPALTCTATDSLLGEVFNGVLPTGDTVLTPSREVQEGDPDPLVNTVTLTCSPDGFPNVLEASDGHSTNLFQPAIDVDKTGDTLSKIGDSVSYTITLSNNSSADTPDLDCTATDTLLGELFSGVLSPGDTVLNESRTVLDTDPDPLVNTVTLTCSPAGFPNVLEESDSHSVNLFQPGIAVDKTGDDLSKIGDVITYTITLSNSSSADTPAMNCVADDSLLGEVFNGVLPLGDTVLTPSRVVEEEDPDPLVNTVTLTCSPEGFPNVLEESDGHSTNLFQPAIDVDKTGETLSKIGDTVAYNITLSNNSSADTPAMNCVADDSLLGELFNGVLPLGDTELTPTRVVEEGDPDPLVNTVTLTCSPEGFPNILEADDDHSVNLFQPAIDVDKTGDTLSKIGDTVAYTITLSNNSSADTPAMNCVADDSLLGEVFNGVLPLGDTELTPTRVVEEGDSDPLVNTVTLTCSPEGFPNILEADDDHSVNLFQPAIAVDKTGDALSKIGDDVNYNITLSNNSSADTPAMNCVADDSLLGELFNDVLPPGDTVLTPSRTVQAGDPDPLVNTVTLTCSPAGFPNVLEKSDSHSVNLFQPAIGIAKTGDPLSKVGDDVNYTITLSNNSSADTPALTCTATDSLLDAVFSGVLPLGDTVLNLSRTVQAGDPDPLVNSVSMTCSVAGFPNVLNAGPAVHSTNLFQPGIEVIKTGPSTAARGDTITYNFTINNLSSADSPNLILDSVTDTVIGDLTAAAAAGGCGSLASGGSCNFTADYTIAFDDPSPLVNVVTVHYHPDGFPNDITDDDDHSVQIPIQGCTPGFWQGGAGAPLWDQPDDEDWTGADTNPFVHTTLFNTFFNGTTDSRLAGQTMYQIVSNDGGSANSAEKAARDMVAAYLNESAFPSDFPADSLPDLVNDWYAAVAGGDAGLDAFHVIVSGWNSPQSPGYCPLP